MKRAGRWAAWLAAVLAPCVTARAAAATARAVIQPSHDINVVSPVGGVIQRVLVKEGDRVKEGQVLVELDAEVHRAALAISEQRAKSTARIEAAQANLDVKRVGLERQKTLQTRGVASDADVDEADLEMKAAQAQLTVSKEEKLLYQLEVARDRKALARLTIRAPMAGIITRRIQDMGEAAEEFQPLVQLVVLDVLHVMAHVPQDVAAALKPGDAAEVVLDGKPDVRHPCRVLVIDPVIDAASETVRVKLELPNPKYQVAAGARATVIFPQGQADAGPKAAPTGAERRP